jgi:hypothetical protein
VISLPSESRSPHGDSKGTHSQGLDAVVFSHDACSFHHCIRVINDALGVVQTCVLNIFLHRYLWYFDC